MKIVGLTPELWEKYKKIRLRGLREEPQAFARSYDEEMAFPIEKWIERSSNPYNFMAIENGVPLGTAGVYFVNDAGEKIANIVGVFVVNEARGRKIGSKLIETVINRLKQEKETKKIRINVNIDQEAAVELYKKFGFEVNDEEIEKMGDGQEHSEYLMELSWN
jgi:ribosomal protein S18 acetylase RimI-like enzyme